MEALVSKQGLLELTLPEASFYSRSIWRKLSNPRCYLVEKPQLPYGPFGCLLIVHNGGILFCSARLPAARSSRTVSTPLPAYYWDLSTTNSCGFTQLLTDLDEVLLFRERFMGSIKSK